MNLEVNQLIKECKVILENDDVMVVDFEGKKVQLTSNKLFSDIAYVKYDKGKYTLTDKLEYERLQKKKVGKTVEKKLFEDPVLKENDDVTE